MRLRTGKLQGLAAVDRRRITATRDMAELRLANAELSQQLAAEDGNKIVELPNPLRSRVH